MKQINAKMQPAMKQAAQPPRPPLGIYHAKPAGYARIALPPLATLTSNSHLCL